MHRSNAIQARIEQVTTHGTIAIPLSDLIIDEQLAIYPDTQDKNYFRAYFSKGKLHLTVGPFMGLIPINPRLTINVRPRLPPSNLARIIDIAQLDISSLAAVRRTYMTEAESTGSIVEFLARNLLTALHEVEIHGLRKVYVSHTENSSRPRGRIHMRETALLNFSRGIWHKVYNTVYEQTADEPYNRLLKYALWFLAQRLNRLPRRTPSIRKLMRDLNYALNMLEGVTLERSISLIMHIDNDLREQRLPASRGYYERPLRIALTILAGKGVSLVQQGTDVELASYVINVDDLFEAYLRQILHGRLSSLHPGIKVRDGNKDGEKRLYDDSKKPPANPDIVLGTRPVFKLVADVKYKDKVERDDINQIITYGCSYGAPVVVLIHHCAASQPRGKTRLGAIGGMQVFTYAFDLTNPILEEEEQAFAESLAALL